MGKHRKPNRLQRPLAVVVPVGLGIALLASGIGPSSSNSTADVSPPSATPTPTVKPLPVDWYHVKPTPAPTHTVKQKPVVHRTVTHTSSPTVTPTPTRTHATPPPVTHVPVVTGMSFNDKVLKLAESQIGIPYVYGGESPGVDFDCSGLVQWAYAQAGASVPRVTDDQFRYFKMIPKSQARPGDLVFFHNDADPSSYVYHVGIYVGNNDMMVVAPAPGLDVQIQNFDWGGDTITFGTLDIG